jgi:hypothetical protein
MKNVIQIQMAGTLVNITKIDREYELRWSDGVANEWVEKYPLLSLAFVRVGALIHCAEQDWEVGFNNSNNDFVLNASLFLESEVA